MIYQISEGGSISLELEDLKPGPNDFDFSINGTKFADPSLPTVMNDQLVSNTFMLYTDPRCQFVSMSSKLQMELHWKVQLIGNWSEELGNIIDCKVYVLIIWFLFNFINQFSLMRLGILQLTCLS